MCPSRIIKYQDPLYTFIFNLVAKVQIFIKLLMYVLSHGFLLSSYKAFFHLHTWFFLSCVFLVATNVSSYFMPYFREKPRVTNLALYPTMLPSTTCWILQIHMEDNMEFPSGLWHPILVIILNFGLFRELSSLVLCRQLYVIFPTCQMH